MSWSGGPASAVLIAAVLAGTSPAPDAARLPAAPGGPPAASAARLPAGPAGPPPAGAAGPGGPPAAAVLAAWQRRADGPGGSFGSAVAVSGSTAVVGAPLRHSQAGAAYVFVRTGAKWKLQAMLTAARPAAGEQFGGAVAVSGSTLVIGAAWEDTAGTGLAYVFARRDGRWSQQAVLSAAHGAYGDGFGVSVAMSHTTVVVGAPYRANEKGGAYVFARDHGRWFQQARLMPSPAARDLFGASVTVSGSTVVAGAENFNAGRGTAFVFTRAGARWSQQARLTTSGLVANDFFGSAVAVSGQTAVIGSDGWNIDRGEVLVFSRPPDAGPGSPR